MADIDDVDVAAHADEDSPHQSPSSQPPPSQSHAQATTQQQQQQRRGIAVACRVRPLSAAESAAPGVHHGVSCLDDSIIIDPTGTANGGAAGGGSSGGTGGGRRLGPAGTSALRPTGGPRASAARPRQFPVDQVFHEHVGQDEVYRAACSHVVRGVFDGINGSILAYGATGSGKTHTMFGNGLSAAGVIYRAAEEIFAEKERLEAEGRFVTVLVTFMEVYNEDVFDLLSTTSKRQALQICDEEHHRARTGGNNGGGGGNLTNPESVSIRGLTRAAPSSLEEFDAIIERGRNSRFVAATNANDQSSRSHAVISVEVEVRAGETAADGTVARLRLCDLAGSERAAATQNRGLRIREGGNINKSLLALGAVVQALAKRSKLVAASQATQAAQVFVPHRGSKLTRLLRDCLGGTCFTAMIFCLSPASAMFEENVNTMLFAMQARLVQVDAKRNEFRVDTAGVARCQEAVIERQRTELFLLREAVLKMAAEAGLPIPDIATPQGLNAAMGSVTPRRMLSQSLPPATASSPQPSNSGSGIGAAFFGGGTGGGASQEDITSSGQAQPSALELLAASGGGGSGSVSASALITRQRSPSVCLPTTPTGQHAISLNGTSTSLFPNANTNGSADGFTSHALGHGQTPREGSSSSITRWGASGATAATATPPSTAATPAVSYFETPMWAELQARVKQAIEAKTDVARALHDTTDRLATERAAMRERRAAVCAFMATMPRGEIPDPPPVRIAGLFSELVRADKTIASLVQRERDLTQRDASVTAAVNTLGRETMRERTANPAVQLLTENLELRLALSDAETIAAQYHGRIAGTEARLQEALHSLRMSEELLRELLPLADAKDRDRERELERQALVAGCGGSGVGAMPAPSSLGRRCASALAACKIPCTDTDALIDAFRHALARAHAKLTSRAFAAMGSGSAADAVVVAGHPLLEAPSSLATAAAGAGGDDGAVSKGSATSTGSATAPSAATAAATSSASFSRSATTHVHGHHGHHHGHGHHGHHGHGHHNTNSSTASATSFGGSLLSANVHQLRRLQREAGLVSGSNNNNSTAITTTTTTSGDALATEDPLNTTTSTTNTAAATTTAAATGTTPTSSSSSSFRRIATASPGQFSAALASTTGGGSKSHHGRGAAANGGGGGGGGGGSKSPPPPMTTPLGVSHRHHNHHHHHGSSSNNTSNGSSGGGLSASYSSSSALLSAAAASLSSNSSNHNKFTVSKANGKVSDRVQQRPSSSTASHPHHGAAASSSTATTTSGGGGRAFQRSATTATAATANNNTAILKTPFGTLS